MLGFGLFLCLYIFSEDVVIILVCSIRDLIFEIDEVFGVLFGCRIVMVICFWGLIDCICCVGKMLRWGIVDEFNVGNLFGCDGKLFCIICWSCWGWGKVLFCGNCEEVCVEILFWKGGGGGSLLKGGCWLIGKKVGWFGGRCGSGSVCCGRIGFCWIWGIIIGWFCCGKFGGGILRKNFIGGILGGGILKLGKDGVCCDIFFVRFLGIIFWGFGFWFSFMGLS